MGDDLQEMDARIERLDAECMTAESNVDDARKRMNDAWESLTEHQASYRRYKQEADEEFRLSRESWDNGDRAAAKVYSNSGHALNAKRRECSRAIDEARSKYDECRDEFEAAKSARDSLRKRLRSLRPNEPSKGIGMRRPAPSVEKRFATMTVGNTSQTTAGHAESASIVRGRMRPRGGRKSSAGSAGVPSGIASTGNTYPTTARRAKRGLRKTPVRIMTGRRPGVRSSS